MGVKFSKRYSSCKSQPKVLKLVLNFPPDGPHKITMGSFEIFSFWTRDACITTVALLTKSSRATVVAQAPVSPSSVNSGFLGNRCMDEGQTLWVAAAPPYLETILFPFFFSNFSIFQIFKIFFFVFLNMRPYGSKKFKTLLLLRYSPDLSQTI